MQSGTNDVRDGRRQFGPMIGISKATHSTVGLADIVQMSVQHEKTSLSFVVEDTNFCRVQPQLSAHTGSDRIALTVVISS